MKKRLFVYTAILLLGIGLWSINEYVSHNGKFTKWGHSTLEKSLFENGKAYFIDYPFRWEGIGNPELQNVEFIKRDGSILAKDDDHFLISPFISKVGRGQFDEETAIKEGLLDDLIPVKGFKVKDDFHLVLRAQLNSDEVDNDIRTVRITYKKFGKTQFQNIHFDEGIITGE